MFSRIRSRDQGAQGRPDVVRSYRRHSCADKPVITYARFGKLKERLMANYNEKRKYGVIPQPAAGECRCMTCALASW
jgi:hypothetical protein